MSGYFKLMKRRGIKPEVNWWRDRWRKKVKGKMIYFRQPDTKEGYSLAVAEYHCYLQSLKPTRAHEETYRKRLDILETLLAWYKRYDVPDEEMGVDDELDKLVSRIELELTGKLLRPIHNLLPDGATIAEKKLIMNLGDFHVHNPYVDWSPAAGWMERVRQIKKSPRKVTKQTVAYWSERQKEDWELKQKTGKLVEKTVGDYTEKLDYFISLIGGKTPVEDLAKGPLNFLYRHLSERVISKEIKGRRANNLTKSARRFVNYCWRQDDCLLENIPKAIDDPDLLFANDDSEVNSEDLWTHEDLQKLISNCPIRYQAFVFLGLNCGLRNTDLSRLTLLGKSSNSKRVKYGIDMASGRLIWRRPKTERFKPPTVNYKLWDLTIELLKRTRGNDPEFWFSSDSGGRLVYGGTDLLASGWKKLRHRPKKKLESCRDTGTTIISDEVEFKAARLDQLFLGQVCTIADRHYNAHDGKIYPPMDDALKHLEKKLKIKKLRLSV